jgi:signal transduction histidine kinase
MATTVWLLAGNVAVLTVLALVGWHNRDVPGARPFVALQVASVVWMGLTILGLRLAPGPERLAVWGATVGASLVVSALWLAFIFAYTGRDGWLRRRRFGPVVAPLLGGAALYAVAPTWSPLAAGAEQATIPAGTVVRATVGPLGGLLGLYLYGVFLVGLWLVVEAVLDSNRLFAGQALALVLGTLVTVVASATRVLGVLPVAGYPVTQVFVGAQSLLWGYAVFRHQFLQRMPAVTRVGERVVFDELEDGLLVVGDDDVILRANPRAGRYLGGDGVVGRDLDAVFEGVDVDPVAGLPQRFERRGRVYQVDDSTVRDWRDTSIGRAVVVREVTPLVRGQQRLQVLNRVLRHNVRNDMTVVLGAANWLERHDDEAVANRGTWVARTVDSLIAISEKATEVEKLLGQSRRWETVDLGSLVDGVVSPLADRHPEATVTVTVDDERLRTDRELLAAVLREVVQNALEHAGEAPRVAVEATRRDGDVAITVADDGPGVPEFEVEPIESGGETPLTHASSLGLWLVYWGVQSLGGDVTIDTDGEGTTVRLTVADAPDVAGTGRPPG